MSVRSLSLIATVVLASIVVAPGARAAVAPPALSATTPTCRTGATQSERYAVFSGSMPMRRGAHRLGMQLNLMVRRPGDQAFVAAAAPPGFARWRLSKPRVRGFIFSARVDGMEAPATYRVLVRFRWLSKGGDVVATASRTSPVCLQPDQRPDLGFVGIAAGPVTALGMQTYRITVANTGAGAAGPFVVALAVSEASSPVRGSAPGLAAAARATVDVIAPACAPGTRLSVLLDSEATVAEAVEDDNTVQVACPKSES